LRNITGIANMAAQLQYLSDSEIKDVCKYGVGQLDMICDWSMGRDTRRIFVYWDGDLRKLQVTWLHKKKMSRAILSDQVVIA
jgi:hypothetical protein